MAEKNDALSSSEVFRFGGTGTLLLIGLFMFVGLHPLMLGGFTARILGGLIIMGILVAGTLAASRSHLLRGISAGLGVLALGAQLGWLITRNKDFDIALMFLFAVFCFYTAAIILRHVLAFGPLYADRVHAALSVYILLAMAWAGAYGMIEVMAPGSFSIPAEFGHNPSDPQGMNLLASMFHLSMATLTSTGYGDITPVAPFARSLAALEQLIGVFYIAVLISRLIGLYPSEDKV
ncbi:MAG: ion channel [Pseudorhodoplanes sp.]